MREGDGGRVSRFKIMGDVSPEVAIFKETFLNIYHILDFPKFPKYSGRNPRRNQNLGVGGFHSNESVSQSEFVPPPPVEISWRRPWGGAPFTTRCGT